MTCLQTVNEVDEIINDEIDMIDEKISHETTVLERAFLLTEQKALLRVRSLLGMLRVRELSSIDDGAFTPK